VQIIFAIVFLFSNWSCYDGTVFYVQMCMRPQNFLNLFIKNTASRTLFSISTI